MQVTPEMFWKFKKEQERRDIPSSARITMGNRCDICGIGLGKSIQSNKTFKHASDEYQHFGYIVCRDCKEELPTLVRVKEAIKRKKLLI